MRLRSYVSLAVVVLAAIIMIIHPWTSSTNVLAGLNDTLTKINGPLDNFKDFLLSLLVIVASFLLVFIMIGLFKWLRKDEGVFIQPFVVGCCNDSYNGNAISDLLNAELLKIRTVHEIAKSQKSGNVASSKNKKFSEKITSIFKKKQEKSKQEASLEKTKLVLPSFIHSSENLAYNISSVNISGGPVTISVGQMLLLLKKISGRPVNTITGSIQKYGNTITLIAWMGGLRVGAWEVNRDIFSQTPSTGDDYYITDESVNAKSRGMIPEMVKDLAFKVAMNISMTEIEAKTWIGLKIYTEALDEYNHYRLQGDPNSLKRIRALCVKAAKAERDYKEPGKLLSDIGIEYYEIGKYGRESSIGFY
jgi:hypothetical protein